MPALNNQIFVFARIKLFDKQVDGKTPGKYPDARHQLAYPKGKPEGECSMPVNR